MRNSFIYLLVLIALVFVSCEKDEDVLEFNSCECEFVRFTVKAGERPVMVDRYGSIRPCDIELEESNESGVYYSTMSPEQIELVSKGHGCL